MIIIINIKDSEKAGLGKGSRIGDGVLFVGKVLDGLVEGSVVVRAEVERRLVVVEEAVSVDHSKMKWVMVVWLLTINWLLYSDLLLFFFADFFLLDGCD